MATAKPPETPGLPPIDPVPPQSPLGRHPGAARVMLWIGIVLAVFGVWWMFPGLQFWAIPVVVIGVLLMAFSRFIA